MFDEIGAVNRVQRGGVDYESSGKAIDSLLQAGDTALTYLKEAIEEMVTDWGLMRIKNIQQFFQYEDALRISDDLKSYQLKWEHWTDPKTQETTLSLMKEEDDKMADPVRILTDIETAEFDIGVGIESKYSQRNKSEKYKRDLELFDRGILDIEYIVFNMDLADARGLWERMQQKDEMKSRMAQFDELLNPETPQGQILIAMQDPQLMTQVAQMLQEQGVDIGQAVQQMVTSGQAVVGEPPEE